MRAKGARLAGATVGGIFLALLLAVPSVPGAAAGSPKAGAPVGPNAFWFVNESAGVRNESSAARTGWTSATAVGTVGGRVTIVTVGDRGVGVVSGSAYPSLPNISRVGLTDVAFGLGRFVLTGMIVGPTAITPLLYEYFPGRGSVTNLSTRFANFSGNTGPFAVAWNGTDFLLLAGRASPFGGYSGLLYALNPRTLAFSSLSSKLPAGFRSLGSCCGENALLSTPSGLLITVWSTAGATFGELRWNGSFVDLSSRLDPYFTACDASVDGTGRLQSCQGTAANDLTWNGTAAWLLGLSRGTNAPRLYAIDPRNATVTNETTLIPKGADHPDAIASTKGRIFLAGEWTPGSRAALPLFLVFDTTRSVMRNDSSVVPAGYWSVETLVSVAGSAYLTGGSWGYVQYALLVVV